MAEKINHGRSKMISNYGGVGSVVDTPDASIIIETFDNWGYDYENLKNHIIKDDRLVNRLRTRFPRLRNLVNIPTETEDWRTDVEPKANYFPKWFYCPRCKRFMHLKQWKNHWIGNREFDLQCFDTDCKDEHLEQVRFVMTCDNGHIQDLPWEYWNNRIEEPQNVSENDEDEGKSEPKIILNFEKPCCPDQELYYRISNENTDLSGVHIKCEKCKKSATLKGVFGFQQNCGGLRYWFGLNTGVTLREEGGCNQKSKVKIKSSNSIYYANTLSSLWIPEKQVNIKNEHRQIIEKWLDRGKSREDIINDMFDDYDIPRELTNQYLDEPENTYVPEIVYRRAEYDYFTQKEQPENKAIKFRQINVKESIYGFEKLVKIDRLKKITVQTSFTRNNPIDTDSILIGDGYEYTVQRQSVSIKDRFETRWLPAIENYGEGILFVLDEQNLKQWENQSAVIERIEIMQQRAEGSDWESHKIEARELKARKVLIHTLAHLLTREFEYVCGYPMSSLQERLYVSDNMNGFLISAFDGADGYLGGLTKLCNNLDKLQEIVLSALERAKDCSLDPICYENEDGQGISQLNLAACQSCTLIPETSCEMSNLFLDRRFVIDNDFGYFK